MYNKNLFATFVFVKITHCTKEVYKYDIRTFIFINVEEGCGGISISYLSTFR